MPVVRRTVAAVIDRAGFAPGSHDAKALVEVLEAYGRRELLEMTADELLDVSTGILDLSQRQRVRCFARPDRFGRFWSCQVFVPLDRFLALLDEIRAAGTPDLATLSVAMRELRGLSG